MPQSAIDNHTSNLYTVRSCVDGLINSTTDKAAWLLAKFKMLFLGTGQQRETRTFPIPVKPRWKSSNLTTGTAENWKISYRILRRPT